MALRQKITRAREDDIKRGCLELIQRVTNELSEKKDWAPALRAAPAAICVMATCLIASFSEEAGTIQVKCSPKGGVGNSPDLPCVPTFTVP
jgi:hypothetical protein